MTRGFLALVGLMYLLLAGWCSVAPQQTSQKVGFELQPGAGQSEFLVIYGGLELALALLFLAPLFRPQVAMHALIACLIVHACLVIFRTASFFLYSGIGPTTNRLAVAEWVILLGAAGIWLRGAR